MELPQNIIDFLSKLKRLYAKSVQHHELMVVDELLIHQHHNALLESLHHNTVNYGALYFLESYRI